MRRDGHDGTSAVGDENVVGSPDGNLGAIDRVKGVRAREHAGLFLIGEVGPLEVALIADGGHVGRDGGLLLGRGNLLKERMFRSDDHVGRTEKRIRTGREDGQRVRVAFEFKSDLSSFGLADPVLLEALGGIGPIDVVEAFNEFVGVGRDAEDPLADGAPLHGMTTAFGAGAFGCVVYFLVREHRAEVGAEPDGFLGDVSEAVTEEFKEDPLRPAEVVLVGRGQLAVPVDGEAEHLQLATEVVDIATRLHGRVFAGGDGVLFRGQAEGVPTHRVEDVEALGFLVAAQDVGSGVALGVADMEARPGRVGEHV